MLHPEPEAPVDSAPTKPGLPSARGNRRWLGLSVTTLLLLSVAIAVYLFSYVAARRTDLSSRALRTLLVVGEDFSAQLSQMGPILRQVHEKVACPIGGQAAGDDAHPDSLLRETIRLIPNLRADKQEGFERPSSPDTFSGAALQIEVANGATLRFAYFPSDGDSAPCPVSRRAADNRGFQALYAAADFSSLLQAHDLEREFDEVFVAADDGTVLHRERLREGLGGFALTDLRGVANLADDPIDSDSLGGASRTFQVELAGEAYVLYLHPMRPPLPTHLKTPHSDSVKAVDELLIGGLVNRGWLQARSRELPHKVMIALLAVLLVGVLSAPFLKLWYLGGRERFAAFDVLLLGASSLVTAALLTFLVIDVLEYSHLKKELDREAESLADDLLSNLDAEVALAARELRQFFRVVDLDASGETPDATEILKGFSEVSFATYPFMEMIFWADSTGWQQQKWTVRAQATPRVNISDRYYFRAANSGQMRPASLGGGAGSNDTSGFAFEFIQSRTTGESLAVISIALDSIRHPTGTVGAMVISPLSLAAPVLPVGFGFSIIDEAGEIVSSTETRRKENLLVECGNDRLLRSALFTRRSESLTLRCRGARDRIHIRPMGYHRYALVVHRDMAILGTINFEIAISAILFFCLPVVLALIVVSSVLTVLRRHPAWLWPDDHRIPNYFQAMVIVLAFGGWLIIAAPSYPAPVRLLMVLGIPLAILLLVALTLHIQIGAKAPATDGSAANTARRLLVVYRQYIPSASAAVTALLLGMASGDVGAALVVGAIATLAASPPATGWIARRIGGRREPALRAGFVGLGFSLLVALAVGPSLLLFRDAFAHGMESLTRLEQLHLAKTLRAHDESIIDEPRYARAQRCPACPSEPEAPVVLQSQMPNQWSVYRSRVFDDSITRPRKFRAPRTSGPDGLHALVARHFTSLLPAIAPAYSPTVERFRRIGIDRNLKNRWGWDEPTAAGLLRFVDSPAESESTIEVTSQIPAWTQPLTLLLDVPGGILAVLLAAGVAIGVLYLIAHRVFGLDLDTDIVLDTGDIVASGISDNLLLLRPPKEVVQTLCRDYRTFVIDLAKVPDARPATYRKEKSFLRRKIVVLDHMDFKLDSPEHASKRLALLMQLVFVHRKRVVAICGIEPLYYLRHHGSDTQTEGASPLREQDLAEWGHVLSKFVKSRFLPHNSQIGLPDPATAREPESAGALAGTTSSELPEDTPHRRRLTQALEVECAGDPDLLRLARSILRHSRLEELSKRQVKELLGDMAEAYYSSLWSGCLVSEKMALILVAQTGFVNPNSWEDVRRLCRRNLLVKDPAVRLKNESFRNFVLRVEASATVSAWEREHGVSLWSRLRGPLTLAAIVVAGFFLLTQQDQVNQIVAFVGSLTVLVPTVIRLLNFQVATQRIPQA